MPKFPIDPTGFRMPNSGLYMGAKHGTPIQKNYGKGMPLTEGGKKSIMASDANPEFKAAIAKADVDSPNAMYSPIKKYKNAGQRKAAHASMAEEASGTKYASPAKKDWGALAEQASKDPLANPDTVKKLKDKARHQQSAKKHMEENPDASRVDPYASGEKTINY